MIVNDNDNLYYDAKDIKGIASRYTNNPELGDGYVGENEKIQGYSVGLDFTMSTQHMFGIPERSNTLSLNVTHYDKPYRLFNQDKAPHFGDNSAEYGSVPYIMGHSAELDESVAWMNSAETFVFINEAHAGERLNAAFISEGNALEFYLLASQGAPKKLQKKLSELTGYVAMPPIHSLGFHFSKWENVTATDIVTRSHDFDHHNYPVDVFWFDIEYSQKKQYTEFDYQNFNQKDVMLMNDVIAHAKRRFVVIVDPHIRASEEFHVYNEGLEKQHRVQKQGDIENIFVRDPAGKDPWVGNCWPGESVWFDFLNENAAQWWGDLLHPSTFIGTNYLYGIWNDMNEPSVFKSGSLEEIEQLGMPMNNTHILKDGSLVQHRWVHNAYGALQQRATWNGLHKRDKGQQRPFVLSRSFFFGSQRYGAIWTGDNTASYDDVPLALNSILADGIAGIVFAGADVPGFNKVPDDDIFVQFYQLAAYFPFFRAHAGKFN